MPKGICPAEHVGGLVQLVFFILLKQGKMQICFYTTKSCTMVWSRIYCRPCHRRTPFFCCGLLFFCCMKIESFLSLGNDLATCFISRSCNYACLAPSAFAGTCFVNHVFQRLAVRENVFVFFSSLLFLLLLVLVLLLVPGILLSSFFVIFLSFVLCSLLFLLLSSF